ncbi:MAG: YqaE/Pmp3 family membrane protein [Acidithiobacillus sp.]|nr:YqaE/Pmp3 family membrane protein [Acidithiobacillus sp.]
MRLLLALLIPCLQFFTIGRPFAKIICLILQRILISWVPAAIRAVPALRQYETDRKILRLSSNSWISTGL